MVITTALDSFSTTTPDTITTTSIITTLSTTTTTLTPLPLPVSPTYLLGYRATMIRLRAEAPSTSHSPPPHIILSHTKANTPPSGTSPLLPIPTPTSSPSLLLPSTDHGANKTEDEILVDMPGEPATDDTELGRWMTEFATRVRQDTNEIYVRLDDEQTERQLMDGRLNIDLARSEVMSPRTTVLGQQAMITALQAADRRRQKMSPKKRTMRLNPETTTTNPATTPVTNAQLKAMIDQGVTTALAARDANMNGVDSHNSGTGVKRNEQATRECTYPDFMKCQPLNFKGTEGVVKLTQWVEKKETMFRISNNSVENQIKFSTCTLLGNALTWWNSHVRTVGNEIAYAMTWTELKKKMTDKYCPRTEIKKLKVELWDLKVKGTDVIGGLLDMIHGSVVASKPKKMQEANEIATKLMDKRIRTFVERQTKNKRKKDNNQQQPQNKRQNNGMAYAAGTGENKLYGGSKPLCPKSPTNANTTNNQRGTGIGQKPTCYECGAQGHFKRECPQIKNNNNRGNPAGNVNAPAKVYAVGYKGTNPDFNVVMGTFLLNNRYASILFDTGADRSFMSTAFSS
ncbi:reverse transcriptase domain-containing protein [Tanacetum coccineum]|uniref:Reverse transcriptase domain-containing protein n=1 Tax=Tanacetum coccineum TaxID=301880 RepID=A0ABQ5GNN6_9ASTR